MIYIKKNPISINLQLPCS